MISESSISVPRQRIQVCNGRSVNGAGDYVLYWMIAVRRRHWNFALQRAVHWAVELRKPLLIVEALSCTYRWASVRIHTALLQGMYNNFQDFDGSGVLYYPFIERFPFQGKEMIKTLAQQACVVVTDDFPAFEIPKWIAIAALHSRVLVEKVDSNGILPMHAAERTFSTAHSFRRFLQSELPKHLAAFPLRDALENVELPQANFPSALRYRWPPATAEELFRAEQTAAAIPVDKSVPMVSSFVGGASAARARLKCFIDHGINEYAGGRNDLAERNVSGLSPYLHFGHISAHEAFDAVMRQARWSKERLDPRANGSREGWWHAGPDTEAFIDQLLTWREIGFNMCSHNEEYDKYESLPEWALRTLSVHASDARPVLYSSEQFEDGETDDDLWNAAQMQLVVEGRIHNYLRMLWGKKILEWSATPQAALQTMIELNNKYALDGRDPNSYSGIFWILGRYDRPWGPERPIFGTVRYMSSANTARKLNVKDYVRRYSRERAL
jgi:deoxyribodipyrimidine photo-lyase